ncbi:MAG: two-component system response regulator [Zetaproteobacteria bacterium]|nr:two-component system response regulator [Pseudobdellovibrionaceae bacterium]|tara:strand:- start:792 stop:1172 length:381 start_codon:yes stop_codon:yes gene_type:complete
MSIKILLVDDDSNMFHLVEESFRENGFELIYAEDGEAGFKAMQDQPDIKVIITDHNMPKLTGIQMLEKIRGELPCAEGVHFVMQTSASESAVREKGTKLGVKAWIVKSGMNSIDIQIKAIKKLLAL